MLHYRHGLWILALIMLLFYGTPPDTRAQEGSLPPAFPLTVGTYWDYQGSVRWTEGTEVKEKSMIWRMEVLDKVERGPIVGYAMHGHPSDLAWYEEDRQPSEYAIIQVGENNRYYRTELSALDRMRDENDNLSDLVHDSSLFLDLPLVPNKRFCNEANIARVDGWYCWIVQSGEPALFPDYAQGVPELEYTLRFQTLPDHTIVKFVPGIGISGYQYVHHGTVSEVNVWLVEFHPGETP